MGGETDGMIDFVIVSYNTIGLLKALYGQLRNMHVDRNIIIVDNASTDGTREWLNRLSIPTVIVNDENRGYATAANQGAAKGAAEFIGFLNTDVILVDGWLDGVMLAFEDADVVAVTPEMVDADGEPYRHDYINGACLVVRRGFFEAIGGFDDEFTFGHDDTDFTFRVEEAGRRWTKSTPAITHLGGMSRDEETNALVEAGRDHMRKKWDAPVLGYAPGHDWRGEARGPALIGVPASTITRGKLLELGRRDITKEDLIESGLYQEIESEE